MHLHQKAMGIPNFVHSKVHLDGKWDVFSTFHDRNSQAILRGKGVGNYNVIFGGVWKIAGIAVEGAENEGIL